MARLTNYPESKLIKVLWRQASCAIEMEDLGQITCDLIEMSQLIEKLKIRHLHVDMSRCTA